MEDGINDQLVFFFKSEYEFTGELKIFDRWGGQLFNAKNVSETNPVNWDGTFNGKTHSPAVFIWVFKYISSQDNKTRVISGSTTLIR